MRGVRFAGLLFLCAAGGCLPVQYEWRPGVRGKVVDANTQAPVAGAMVTLIGPLDENSTEHHPARDAKQSQAITNSEGSFEIAAIRRTYLAIMFPSWTRFASRADATIKHPAYLETHVTVVEGDRNIEIAMKRR